MPVQVPRAPLVDMAQYPSKAIVRTPGQIQAMVSFLGTCSAICFDFETSGLAYYKSARPCGIALGAFAGDGQVYSYYVPYRHLTGEEQCSEPAAVSAYKSLLENTTIMKIAHNIKFDDHMARLDGVRVLGPRYDTMIAGRLYDENRSAGLKYRAVSDLHLPWARNFDSIVTEQVAKLARSRAMPKREYLDRYGYSEVQVDLCGVYACYDVEFTLRLWAFYEQWGVSRYYDRVWRTEMDLTSVLCRMEAAGLRVDTAYLSHLRANIAAESSSLESRIYQIAGQKFKIDSDAQLRRYMQSSLGLAWDKETKSGALSVDSEVLESFAASVPVLGLILQYREAGKLLSTYTSSIIDKLDANDFLHGDLQQVGTDTGRMACRKPNLQNFPADNNDRARAYSGKDLEQGGVDPWSIRRAFTVRHPGWVRLFYDFSQIELRVLAYYSRDPIMVETYQNNEDIHSRTSLEVFGDTAKVNRRRAKVLNFGLSYGMGPLGFARQAKVDDAEAREYMRRFFERYSAIQPFRDSLCVSALRQGGQFSNLWGRTRRIPQIASIDPMIQGMARRQVMGSLIQGTAAELMKEGLVRAQRWIDDRGIEAHLVTTIHDEVQIDCPKEVAPMLCPQLKRMLEDWPELLPIPIICDGEYTETNWAEKKPVTNQE